MILLIDNYDSFVYNLYQLIGSLEPDLQVVRNDAVTIPEIQAMAPEALILSPGPGRPEQAGICLEAVRQLAGQLPILGVCLGHQTICQALGATVTYAETLMHGKVSPVYPEPDSLLFQGIPSPFEAGRYHSLAVKESTLPSSLRPVARADDGELMAVESREQKLFGLQFHPESVLTPEGKAILRNFLSLI